MLYRLSLSTAVLAGVTVIALGLRRSLLTGGAALILSGAGLTVVAFGLRLALESVLALFRATEILSEIAEHEAVIAVNTSSGSRR